MQEERHDRTQCWCVRSWLMYADASSARERSEDRMPGASGHL
jgi:hypothetical protein